MPIQGKGHSKMGLNFASATHYERKKEGSSQNLQHQPQTQNITAYVPQSGANQLASDGFSNTEKQKVAIMGSRPSQETAQNFDAASKKKNSLGRSALDGRNSSQDYTQQQQQKAHQQQQQVITLTVGSPPLKQQVKQQLTQEAPAAGERSSIRVAIPAQLEDFRERNDQSIAATEQNKASVVSNPKISSINSSSAEPRQRIDSQ